MRNKFIAALLLLACISAGAQEKKDIVKTGWNLGPLPVIAYDADKGLQYGAILQLFNYGDGSNYPNYDSKWYVEASFFTKGSNLFTLQYDEKMLIPGVRWSSTLSLATDKAFDFYGFNGYSSIFDYASVDAGKAGDAFLFTPFYRVARTQLIAKSDFTGTIAGNFKWKVGYHGLLMREGAIDYANINKGKSGNQIYPETEPTLFSLYRKWGIISDDEADGGYISSVRAALEYDSRDKEGAPTRGIWAEARILAAPKWLGSTNEYLRYAFTWRQYFPLIKNDVLTFAYRLNYEGTIGNNAPYYVLPYITVLGNDCDKDGFGGYRTTRGIMRCRVLGLDMAAYTAELRWRFTRFQLWNQNICFALSAFSDGTMVTRGRDLSFNYDKTAADYKQQSDLYNKYVRSDTKDTPHIAVGAGLRFIMNENFIVAAEYGMPLSRFADKANPIYRQDGDGAFYVNIGYLF